MTINRRSTFIPVERQHVALRRFVKPAERHMAKRLRISIPQAQNGQRPIQVTKRYILVAALFQFQKKLINGKTVLVLIVPMLAYIVAVRRPASKKQYAQYVLPNTESLP